MPTDRKKSGKALVDRTNRAKRRARMDARTVEIPKCKDQARRDAALADLWTFGQTYFAPRFYFPPAAIHRTLVAKLQEVVTTGGLHALVLPRGSAKTTWFEIGALWGVLTGHRRYIAIVAGTAGLACEILDHIRAEIETNDALAEDFPELCAPARALEGSPQRARTMLAQHVGTDEAHPIGFDWRSDKVTAPPVRGAPWAGSCLIGLGMDGHIRGKLHRLPDGRTVRPDLVLIDDPQTRESAASPAQCQTRLDTINGDVLGLAGPGKKIACLVAATIIRRGDVADQLTDRKLMPAWSGIRQAMVERWADAHESLWLKEYAEIRKQAQRDGDELAHEATEFYRARRAEMDAGCSVYWSARHNADELSAIQHAYNLLIDRGEGIFRAEYQNDPKPPESVGWEIEPPVVMSRLSGTPRGQMPAECSSLTLGADVNVARGINWTLTAWMQNGAGYVVDWGRFPAGDRPLWTASMSNVSEEQAIFSALCAWLDDVWGRPYMRDGERIYPGVVTVDCSYKPQAVSRALHAMRPKLGAATVIPIRGMTTQRYRPPADSRKGDGWHVGKFINFNALFINSDLFRERAQKAFVVAPHCPGGSLALYGDDPRKHQIFAEHICAERVVDVLAGEKLGLVYAWSVLPGRPNDLLDATCYAIAGAAYSGVQFGAQRVARSVNQRPRYNAPSAQPESKPTDTPPVRPASHVPRRHSGGFATGWR